jgi:hypothetical protein
MKKSGIAARNRNGHFGMLPATGISPQSQTVPSTSPSAMTVTVPTTGSFVPGAIPESKELDELEVEPLVELDVSLEITLD